MGAGGNMSVPDRVVEKKRSSGGLMKRPPSEKPPFTLSDLKKAIPPHCFQRSALRAFSYLIRDLIIAYAFYYVADTYIPRLPPNSVYKYAAWSLYWFAQSSMMFAFWVIGHDCGHHSFSEHQWICDTVGFILHSFLFMPYYSWKYTHRAHHLHTNSLEEDINYVPERKSQIKWWYLLLVNNPVTRLMTCFSIVLLGYPLHIIMNFYGQKYERIASHFDPYGPFFNKRERLGVVFSDLGILAVIYVLYRVALIKGAAWVLYMYGIPVIGAGVWFVFISQLQHTHLSVPYYDSTEWDWMRGTLSSIDRSWGTLFNKLYSNAPGIHVVHHLFPTLPQFHAVEAREAIKPILGEYYMYDDTPIMKALWMVVRDCIYVEPEEGKSQGIYWFQKKMK